MLDLMTDSGFPFQKVGVHGKWQARNIKEYSDGEERHWPGKPLYRPSTEENYLIQLGTEWVKRDNLNQPGISYYINRLPKGYAVFDTDQPGGTQKYKRLFGHPSGRYYDSIVKFLPHFLWLMSGMQNKCECVLCSKTSNKPIIRRNRLPKEPREIPSLEHKRAPREVVVSKSDPSTRDSSATGIATGRVRRDVKQLGAPYAQDEEGTEDIYKKFIKRLLDDQGTRKVIVDDIVEKMSLDWRAEHEYDGHGEDILQSVLTRIELQHSFMPRVGELVLWCPNFLDGHFLMVDKPSGEYKFYSFEQRQFHGFPDWRAGVVTEVPIATLQDGTIDFPDLLDLPDKHSAMNQTGFRIETLPDPNEDEDKSWSKQYRFVPLRSIRPLSHWQLVLRGIPDAKLHPSIRNALTCMTSISLMEKFKAAGDGPAATILCEGVFIGSELIIVGDTVRLASRNSSSKSSTAVLVVDSIRLNLLDIKPEHTLPSSPYLCSKSTITIVGKAYSLDPKQHYLIQTGRAQFQPGQTIIPAAVPFDEVRTIFRPVGTAEYGSWFSMHAPNQRYEVSYDQILGRLYEADAVRLWTGQLQQKARKGKLPNHKPSLDFDVSGILSARQYATQTDSRLPEPTNDDVQWFWADTRAEALAVQTINGLEVGKYHDIRDKATLQSWNIQLRILGGLPVTSEAVQLTEHIRRPGRPTGSKVINGKLVLPGDPGYEQAIMEKEIDLPTPQRPKPASQMAGAALVSTDEENESSDGDSLMIEETQPNDANGERERVVLVDKPVQRSMKERIMSGALHRSIEEEEDDEIYEDETDEESWLHQPLPPARGGTEESEGGDYDPHNERSTQATQIGRKSRSGMSH